MEVVIICFSSIKKSTCTRCKWRSTILTYISSSLYRVYGNHFPYPCPQTPPHNAKSDSGLLLKTPPPQKKHERENTERRK